TITGDDATDANAIQTALNLLPALAPTGVIVTPVPNLPGQFDVDFSNPAFTKQNLLTATGSNAFVVISEVQKGGVATGTYGGISYTTYTGTTTVHDGQLLLDQTGGLSILGPLVVGDGINGPAFAQELLSNQIGDGAQVTVNSDGVFDLNGLTDTIGDLTIVDGK